MDTSYIQNLGPIDVVALGAWMRHRDPYETYSEELEENETVLALADRLVQYWGMEFEYHRTLVDMVWTPAYWAEGYIIAGDEPVTEDMFCVALRLAATRALEMIQGDLSELGEDDLAGFAHSRAALKIRGDKSDRRVWQNANYYGDFELNAKENARERRAACWKRTAKKPRKQWQRRVNQKSRKQRKPLDYWGWKALEDIGQVLCKVSPFVGETEKLRLATDAVGSVHDLSEVRYTNDEIGALLRDSSDQHGMTDAAMTVHEEVYWEEIRKLGDNVVCWREEIFSWHREEQLLWEMILDAEMNPQIRLVPDVLFSDFGTRHTFSSPWHRFYDKEAAAIAQERYSFMTTESWDEDPDYGWRERVNSLLTPDRDEEGYWMSRYTQEQEERDLLDQDLIYDWDPDVDQWYDDESWLDRDWLWMEEDGHWDSEFCMCADCEDLSYWGEVDLQEEEVWALMDEDAITDMEMDLAREGIDLNLMSMLGHEGMHRVRGQRTKRGRGPQWAKSIPGYNPRRPNRSKFDPRRVLAA